MEGCSNETKDMIQGYVISFDKTKSQKSYLSNQKNLTNFKATNNK